MISCLEVPRILEFEKKQSLDSSLEEGSQFLVSPQRDQLGSTKCAARGGVRWKSQHRKKLCLSLLMWKNLKLKKVIKSFVPEPILSVFRFLYVYEHLWMFSVSVWICLFHILISGYVIHSPSDSPLGKVWTPLSLSHVLNSTTIFLLDDGFGLNNPQRLSLNKETKPTNQPTKRIFPFWKLENL